ncbi:MAG: hypothetical protein WBW94_07250 [Anaerolineales bacterium]
MKNYLVIKILLLTIFISACSLFSAKLVPTPTSNDTPTQSALPTPTPTLVFKLISTEIPTLIPTLVPTLVPTFEPITTTSPMDALTATMEDTSIPEGIDTSASSSIIGLSIGIDIGSTSGTGTTVSFKGMIEASNETDVEYKWLLFGTESHASSVRKTNIATAGTITIRDFTYKLKSGSYTVGLQIIYPNPVTEKKNFTIP